MFRPRPRGSRLRRSFSIAVRQITCGAVAVARTGPARPGVIEKQPSWRPNDRPTDRQTDRPARSCFIVDGGRVECGRVDHEQCTVQCYRQLLTPSSRQRRLSVYHTALLSASAARTVVSRKWISRKLCTIACETRRCRACAQRANKTHQSTPCIKHTLLT